MGYQNYKNLKETGGPSIQFLISDSGIKMFPVCINMRKFIHEGKNHYTKLSISFDILFNVENYYTVSFDFISSSHHCSQLSPHYEQNKSKLNIHCEPLYEYGNEEEYLPEIAMFSIVKNEDDILNILRKTITVYEEEQKCNLLLNFILQWNKTKKDIMKKSSKMYRDEEKEDWKNFFKLCEVNLNNEQEKNDENQTN